MAEVEDLQRHMVLYQTYLNYFERQSETLANNEENDYCGKNKGALLSSSFMQGTLTPGEQMFFVREKSVVSHLLMFSGESGSVLLLRSTEKLVSSWTDLK